MMCGRDLVRMHLEIRHFVLKMHVKALTKWSQLRNNFYTCFNKVKKKQKTMHIVPTACIGRYITSILHDIHMRSQLSVTQLCIQQRQESVGPSLTPFPRIVECSFMSYTHACKRMPTTDCTYGNCLRGAPKLRTYQCVC